MKNNIILKTLNRLKLFIRLKLVILKGGGRIKIHNSVIIHKGTVIRTPLGGKITIGRNSVIYSGAMILTYGGTIEIGNNCTVNSYTILYGGGDLKIGNGVRIASHSVLNPSNHIYSTKEKYIYQQGVVEKGLEIQDDVWIGAHAVILDGIKIEQGSIIAAGAIVTKSVPSYKIYGGVPAKIIGKR